MSCGVLGVKEVGTEEWVTDASRGLESHGGQGGGGL